MRMAEIDNVVEVDTEVGVMCVMGKEGDVPLRWNRGVSVEVDAAKEHFNALKKKGYAAFKETRSGERGEMITSFDAAAERIIMMPPVSGGCR